MADKVIVVVGSRRDATARTFVERNSRSGVCLMTPDDSSRAGWRYRLGDVNTSEAVVDGRQLASRDICGVLTRMPRVAALDLGHILPADRTYVAAEMNAFLRFWLGELTCPMLNRPTPECLSGPSWQHEKWVNTAARLGIPVATARRSVGVSSTPAEETNPRADGSTVTIVGQRHVGTVDPLLARQARLLADAAGVDLLAVTFSGPEAGCFFVGADLWPDITNNEVANAVVECFQGGRR